MVLEELVFVSKKPEFQPCTVHVFQLDENCNPDLNNLHSIITLNPNCVPISSLY